MVDVRIDRDASSPLRGRPRSELARAAVLHAADDLLVEVGYEALTMKGIAERAGVGRQTVYRWWTSKAEILFEACVLDARHELATTPGAPADTLSDYLERLLAFLNDSDAGATYLALLGASRVDTAVADMLSATDPLRDSTRVLIETLGAAIDAPDLELAIAQVSGPLVFQALTVPGPIPRTFVRRHLDALLTGFGVSTRPAHAI